jgi:hypothetical protein
LGYLYFHHAIVTGIDHAEKKVTLIEFVKEDTSLSSFYKSFSKPIIQERQMDFDNVHEHMYHVVHKNLGTHPPNSQEIVKNARRMLRYAKDERYNAFLNNCEHVVNLCVTKRRISLQIDQITGITISRLLSNPPKWFKYMVGKLGNVLLKILRKFEKVFGDENISKMFAAFDFIKKYLGNWFGSAFFIAMIFMAIEIVQFSLAWKNEGLCRSCIERWIVKTACRVLSMLPFGMVLFLSTVGLGFIEILTYYSLFRDKYSYKKLQTLKSVKPGDVITFNLYMPFSFHDAVVVKSAKTLIEEKIQPLEKTLSAISDTEVLEKSLSMLNDFFSGRTSGKKYQAYQHLRMFVEHSGERNTSKTPYPEVVSVDPSIT